MNWMSGQYDVIYNVLYLYIHTCNAVIYVYIYKHSDFCLNLKFDG